MKAPSVLHAPDALIEAKNRIHPSDVKEFAEGRIEIFRRFFPEFKKHKAYLGFANIINQA